MKNHKEIYEALLAGEILIDIFGNETYLDKMGKMRDTWGFNDPSIWSIKPKKVRYLKSMKQILEEFPDAYFSKQGNLECDGWSNYCIYSDNLQYLGKRIIDEIDQIYWPSYFIEEMEVVE